jgi:hypothetical protein
MRNAVRREDPALADLQYYLRAWRRWVRSWSAPLGYPSQCTFVRHMKPTVAWDGSDHEIEVDQWILRAIDAEIEGLDGRKRAAIRLVYLNEVMPAVFRSLRITEVEAKRLTNEAEVEMIPRLRVRGEVLGGY